MQAHNFETCDDGNDIDTDTCRNDCTAGIAAPIDVCVYENGGWCAGNDGAGGFDVPMRSN